MRDFLAINDIPLKLGAKVEQDKTYTAAEQKAADIAAFNGNNELVVTQRRDGCIVFDRITEADCRQVKPSHVDPMPDVEHCVADSDDQFTSYLFLREGCWIKHEGNGIPPGLEADAVEIEYGDGAWRKGRADTFGGWVHSCTTPLAFRVVAYRLLV